MDIPFLGLLSLEFTTWEFMFIRYQQRQRIDKLIKTARARWENVLRHQTGDIQSQAEPNVSDPCVETSCVF